MANCSNCGKPLKEGLKFCTSCGTAVKDAPAKPAAPAKPVVATQPAAPVGSAAPYATTDEVISTAGWIGYMLLPIIPILGIVLYFVWAFSTGGNLNRRNYCRAVLILMAVSIVLSIIFSVAFYAFFERYINW